MSYWLAAEKMVFHDLKKSYNPLTCWNTLFAMCIEFSVTLQIFQVLAYLCGELDGYFNMICNEMILKHNTNALEPI